MGDMADLISDEYDFSEPDDYEPTWQDKEGRFHDIREMQESHLLNIIRKARREKKEVPDDIFKEWLLRKNGL